MTNRPCARPKCVLLARPPLFPDAFPDAPRALPLLASGLTAATRETSTAAAVSVKKTAAKQRERVFQAIDMAGSWGRTDEEIGLLMGLDGNSVRPRRLELFNLELIDQQLSRTGEGLTRKTQKGRQAVVWVSERWAL